MLAELETELINAVKVSPLANHLREVEVMPEGDGATLIKRFASFAPAVYTVAGDVQYLDATTMVPFDLVLIARNARGVKAARHGDDQTIGLYQMIDVLAAYFDSLRTASAVWRPKRAVFAKGAVWLNNGLQGASLRLETQLTQSMPIDDIALSDFLTFHADYDVDPHQPQAEHLKWVQEPPDYTASRPELTDTTPLSP
jgi:hypothetical protein